MESRYSPSEKPLMVYDGNCGFCKYWVVKWKKISGDSFDYQPYQEVAAEFPDIPETAFQKAVQLILTDGKIFSGARAAYYTFYHKNKYSFLFKWYQQKEWFRSVSDTVYRWVAKNRKFMYDLSRFFFGKDPHKNGFYRFIGIGAFFLLLLIILIYVILL